MHLSQQNILLYNGLNISSKAHKLLSESSGERRASILPPLLATLFIR